MRTAVDHLFREGQLLGWGIPATGVLVETLLDRGGDGDVAEAEAAIDQVGGRASRRRTGYPRNLAAAAAGTAGAGTRRRRPPYRDYRDRYRAMATSLGFEGHMAWAEAMP